MVVALGPGKFYGSSLPRPRIYTDVKLNDHRVDPPVPILDPFMNWAEEAHWSMGGFNLKRLRLQGRIEGNLNKLRAEQERSVKKRDREGAGNQIKRKRRLLMDGEDFDSVAEESGLKKEISGMATTIRSKRYEIVEGNEKVNSRGRKLKMKGQSKGRGENRVMVLSRLAKCG